MNIQDEFFNDWGVFPHARNSDPQTSKDAGNSEEIKIRWGSQRHLILSVYNENPDGLIDEQVGEISGLIENRSCCYWKRCSELRQAGYIELTGEKSKSNCGYDQRVCKITQKGINKLELLGQITSPTSSGV
jgi:hypothetical protein